MFHLQVREMTVTLQDMAVLFGLGIDGPPITWLDGMDCERLLGVALPTTILRGEALKLTWFRE